MTEPLTPIEPDINAEAERLLAEIERAGLDARLIGGMAIRVLAADKLHPAYDRPIEDLDFILAKRHRREFDALLTAAGLYALLHSHAMSAGSDEAIDVERIIALTGNDSGLQHTFELNLVRLRDALAREPLTPEETSSIAQRIDALDQALASAPKSRRWKLRAKVGERKLWYDEPEEVDR